jgi:dihydropteroate synthase
MTFDSVRSELNTRRGFLRTDGGVTVMGILNVTPDSFSDGGHFLDPGAAAAQAERLVAEGADIVDIGAESTRPGAVALAADEELARLLPALVRVRARVRVPLSVDTSKARVAAAALAAGANMVNDVTAGGGDGEMLPLVARAGVPLVLMHMHGTPPTMQQAPMYPRDDVLGAVVDFLRTRVEAALAAGLSAAQIILDPGIGFGKTTAHNLALLDRLDAVVALGYPVLVGPSRKRFIAEIVGDDEARQGGTAAAVAIAVDRGAAMVRVHDVRSMVQVTRVAAALRRQRQHAAAGATVAGH